MHCQSDQRAKASGQNGNPLLAAIKHRVLSNSGAKICAKNAGLYASPPVMIAYPQKPDQQQPKPCANCESLQCASAGNVFHHKACFSGGAGVLG